MSSSLKDIATKLAAKFNIDDNELVKTLKATAFKQRQGGAPITDEQMAALLIVADQYGLNPFTREIFAFPDKQNGIVPVVGVDGWSRIINQHPDFDGMEFRASENMVEMPGARPCPEWMECLMYRKDRAHPTAIREYLDEVYREPFAGSKDGRSYTITGPWQSHTKRFLRHKTMIQAARMVFGFVGIYDEDEAERIKERDITGDVVVVKQNPDSIKDRINSKPKELTIIDSITLATSMDELARVKERAVAELQGEEREQAKVAYKQRVGELRMAGEGRQVDDAVTDINASKNIDEFNEKLSFWSHKFSESGRVELFNDKVLEAVAATSIKLKG